MRDLAGQAPRRQHLAATASGLGFVPPIFAIGSDCNANLNLDCDFYLPNQDQVLQPTGRAISCGTVPRFFFHTNHPAELAEQDDEGMVFPSVHEAKCAAVRYAGQLLADVAEHFWDTADFDLTVTDAQGLILFSMRVVGMEAPAVRESDFRQA